MWPEYPQLYFHLIKDEVLEKMGVLDENGKISGHLIVDVKKVGFKVPGSRNTFQMNKEGIILFYDTIGSPWDENDKSFDP